MIFFLLVQVIHFFVLKSLFVFETDSSLGEGHNPLGCQQQLRDWDQ
jgi:hypothetical protein